MDLKLALLKNLLEDLQKKVLGKAVAFVGCTTESN